MICQLNESLEAKIHTFSELLAFGCLFDFLTNPAGFRQKQYGVSQPAFVENTEDSGNISVARETYKRATEAASRPGRPEGERGSRGSMCSRNAGACRAPTLTPELPLFSVQLSLSLFFSVVATFSLLHFPL